jgi:putative copper export protein
MLAALNRLIIIPRLSNQASTVRALRPLAATILLEQALGAAILLDVSLFGLMDPAG